MTKKTTTKSKRIRPETSGTKAKANQGMSMAEERRRLNAALKRHGDVAPNLRGKLLYKRKKST